MATLGRRANGHDAYHQRGGIAVPACPYCGAEVSRPQFKEIQTRLEMEERARIAKIETDLKARVAREVAKVEASKKTEIDLARKDAVKQIEKKLTLLRAGQQATIDAALKAEREKAAKKVDEAVAAEKLQHTAEKLKLERQLADMQRRLASQPAHKIGEPAEISLFDALTTAFPADRITRVAKGRKGADVIAEFLLPNGDMAGKVLLDSKAHAAGRWSNRFTSKLRADQLDAKADFAVLVSTAFPAGVGELHLQDGVLVVSPARAVVVMRFLRQQVIANHRMKLSAEARDEKGDRLLAYLTSQEAGEHFERLGKSVDDLIELEAREIDMQTGIHRKRGEMIRSVQRTHEELSAQIDTIIAGNESVMAEVSA